MKRIIVIVAIVVLGFFFKDELNSYSISFFKRDQNPASWLRQTSNKAYEKIEAVDFQLVILELRKLEETLRDKKINISDSADTEERRAFNRSFECELAVIYRKLAQWYLQDGGLDEYYEFLNKSSAQLELCTKLRQADT